MNIEDELRIALRREDPPRDFTEKVLAKARPRVWHRSAVLGMAAGLAVAALIPSAISEYHRREEVRGLEARRDLMIALSVTKTKLRETRERVQNATRHAL